MDRKARVQVFTMLMNIRQQLNDIAAAVKGMEDTLKEHGIIYELRPDTGATETSRSPCDGLQGDGVPNAFHQAPSEAPSKGQS